MRSTFSKDEATGKLILSSPHRVLQHLDNSISKATKNVTQNPKMEETLYQISKDLVSSILTKLEIQDKITRITREALEAPGKSKGVTAIETRRILDYISRTLSTNILGITRQATEPELHRLVYGLAQIAAEISIVSALKDITYSSSLSKKQSVDLSLRKKRSVQEEQSKLTVSTGLPLMTTKSVYNVILNKTELSATLKHNSTDLSRLQSVPIRISSPYHVFSHSDRRPVQLYNTKGTKVPKKGFLNQTALDLEKKRDSKINESMPIFLDHKVNGTQYAIADAPNLDSLEHTAPGLMDEWVNDKETNTRAGTLSPDIVAEMELDQPEADDEMNEKRQKLKFDRLESKAKKAILYAGDIAYLAAASVVALRRALTASIEVQMSVRFAKNGMSNHQDLMMNLARTAAQQAGKEAKSASSKSLACERVIKLALKYTAQSHGAKLNHIANRIVMDTLPLGSLAKSMAFVSSDIAINSLYQATDVKPPS